VKCSVSRRLPAFVVRVGSHARKIRNDRRQSSDREPSQLQRRPVRNGHADLGRPSISSITHLAVGSHRSGRRLVPFAYVTSTVPGVELKCTKAEFDAFLSDRDQALASDVADTFADTDPPPRSLGVTLMIDAGLIAPVGIAGPLRPKPPPKGGCCRERTTGVEPATFGLGSRRSTN
jgi:hypothetical protein